MMQVKRLRRTARSNEEAVSRFEGTVDEASAVIRVFGVRKEWGEMGADYVVNSGAVGPYLLAGFIDSLIRLPLE